MNNKRKSNLRLLILLLLLTSVLLISSTYAWFTSNQTVSVSDLQVNVATQNGLQISVDGTNWKSVIQSADITAAHESYATSNNQIPATMEATSTAGIVDANGLLEMYYGTVETDAGNYILTATKDNETEGTTGRFIAFDLFFKVEVNTPVYLTPLSGVTSDSTKGIQNSSRIAFLVEGNDPIGTAAATLQAQKGATSATTYIWEPNYDVHTAGGIANAIDTYGITTTATGGTLLAYDGIKAAMVESDGVLLGEANATDNATFFGTPNITHSTATGFSTNQSLFTLNAGITKVRIYMWIEGQDVDCENNASGANAIFNLDITSNNE